MNEQVRDVLADALEQGALFAVLDAARQDYLQHDLQVGNFKYDALYMDEVENPAIATGPHLVAANSLRDVDRIHDLTESMTGCVWWVWPREMASYQNIYRHLRGINMVEIPKARDDTDSADRPRGFEAVLFRHADPGVLRSVIPTLTEHQLARLLGDAMGVVTTSAFDPQVRVFPNTPTQLSPQRGMLRIAPEEYVAVGENRLSASHQRIHDFVSSHLPPHKAHLTDTDIRGIVEWSDSTGRSLGLKTETGLARWAYIMMLTDGLIASNYDLCALISRGARPDERIKALISEAADAMKRGDLDWDFING